jgi:hypothetical protein
MSSAATVQPWQRTALALLDKLRANPGSKVRIVTGRKRTYAVVEDKNGKVIE